MDVEQKATELANKVNTALEKRDNDIKAMQDHIDKLDVDLKKQREMAPYVKGERGSNLQKSLENSFGSSDQFKSFKEGMIKDVTVKLDLKATDMTIGTHTTGGVIDSQRVPGVIHAPERPEHVRQLIPVGSMASGSIQYVEESALGDGTAMVGEGGLKPKSDSTFGLINLTPKKIATHLKISTEIMNDMPALSSYIAQRFPKKLLVKEDSQLLYGDGLGNNISGLTTNAASYVDTIADASVTHWDVLRAAINQARSNEYKATGIVLHPDDVLEMDLKKDANERYISPGFFGAGASMIKGVPVIETTAMTSGDFLVGDFGTACHLFERDPISVRFYEQNEDDVIYNKITVVIEERIALAIWQPKAFIYGDFPSALAAGMS